MTLLSTKTVEVFLVIVVVEFFEVVSFDVKVIVPLLGAFIETLACLGPLRTSFTEEDLDNVFSQCLDVEYYGYPWFHLIVAWFR